MEDINLQCKLIDQKLKRKVEFEDKIDIYDLNV